MLRQKVGVAGRKQRYERVDPTHSWNSNNIATNVLLYHLQRHSDHHANPTRRYQSLRDFEESPVLPTGYAGMIVLAIVPAVWRRVMDPRVLAHFDGDLSRANLSPRKRDKILAKYPPPDADGEEAATARPVSGRRPPPTRSWPPAAPAAATPTRSRPATSTRASRPARPGPTIPETWCCPDCGVREKVDFVPLTRELRRALPRLDPMTAAVSASLRQRIVEAAVGAHHRGRLVAGHHGQLADRGRRQPADGLQRDRHQAGARRGDDPARARPLPRRGRAPRSTSTPTTWSARSGRRRARCSSSRRTTGCCTPSSPPPTAPTPSCCRC